MYGCDVGHGRSRVDYSIAWVWYGGSLDVEGGIVREEAGTIAAVYTE